MYVYMYKQVVVTMTKRISIVIFLVCGLCLDKRHPDYDYLHKNTQLNEFFEFVRPLLDHNNEKTYKNHRIPPLLWVCGLRPDKRQDYDYLQ